ncbi:MAG: ChaN family lipoprotein [Desulfobacterales bacterium]|jgi:uncharacterized iron-regulated protein
MKHIAITILLAGFLLTRPLSANPDSQMELVDLRSGQTIRLADQGHALAGHRIILVGEYHTAAGHHQAQLAVIQSLVAAGQKVAIGMEMFRRDSQPSLDAWVGGQLKASAFEAVYRDNWNYPWPLYQPILEYARQNRLALVGLNVPRGITRQVAREGFSSLSTQERQDLPFVTCDVDQDYMAYIRQAYGAHGHGQMNFDHFCEAQLVWDKAMAANALRFLEDHPSHVIVVLAGSGHARKGGIPSQLKKMSSIKHLVILPEVPGAIDQEILDHDDADFLIRGF